MPQYTDANPPDNVVPVTVPSVNRRKADGAVRLLVRADDMGAAQAVNEACIVAHRDGIARSVEVIVPGPWFLDAVRLINECPRLDVGVHLCLTSEWERVKWAPITRARSLVDENGYFFPTTSQRAEFPPNTGFLQAPLKMDEVEAELRAQIELARKHFRNLTHLSAHMGTATASPELRQVTEALAREFSLPLRFEGLQGVRAWRGSATPYPEREQAFIAMVEGLQPGTYLFVEHPAYETAEMRAIGHRGYENVASDRDMVTRVFTSHRVREVIKHRGVELISYRDIVA